MRYLRTAREEGGYLFSIEGDEPVSKWATLDLHTATGNRADVSALIEAWGEGRLSETATGAFVGDQELALFTAYDLAHLGLPPAAEVVLTIRTEGPITSPGFALKYSLVDGQGRPWLGVTRDGVLLNRGGREYVLLDPLYSILDRLDAFARLPSDHGARFTAWAEVEALLPADAQLDDQLNSLNIARADRFSLDVETGAQFKPVPLANYRDELSDQECCEPPVPDHYVRQFQNQFDRFSDAHRTYALGEGWYLMVPERTRRALSVVREKQRAGESERRSFLANPHKYIDARAGIEAEGADTESPFIETEAFLSQRVKELGEWVPKLGAYVSSSGTDWLPGEDLLLTITAGDQTVRCDPEDLPDLEARLDEAAEKGQGQVEFQNQHLRPTDDLQTEVKRVSSKLREAAETGDPLETVSKKNLVPILFDNLEELEYEASKREPRQGSFAYPDVLKTRPLYEHQNVGLKWLTDHWTTGSPGALLADDMGLGKTLQALAFMAWVQERMRDGSHPRRPMLIVAPTGLLKNWRDEVGIHLNALGLGSLVAVFGADTGRLRAMSQTERQRTFERSDWVLTTYETLRDQILWFLGVQWSVVAFDEAQKIKNPAARVTEMAKSLKADFSLMLTGTPVENSLADLWCIVDAAQPGLLGAQKAFVREYVEGSESDPHLATQLKSKLQEEISPAPMLRRMKEDHLEGLPEKTLVTRGRPMSPTQADAYDAVLSEAQLSGRKSILAAIQNMRNVSLMGIQLSDRELDEEAIAASARLKETLEILDQIAERREKALIFLESLELQRRLLPYLQTRYGLDRPPRRISGEINGELRKNHVDEFQALPEGEFAVMVLSPKAGGVGLTLTAANHVIHLQRWWNPAVEDQCTDRVYRIGQRKPVQVWYPMAIHPRLGENSFDCNLHRLLEKKRALSRTALIGKVTQQDLEALLGQSAA